MFDLDDYVTMKIWIEYIIPVVVVVALFSILFIRAWIKDKKLQKKIDLLKINGYEKRTKSVHYPITGGIGTSIFAWNKGKHSIDEKELDSMSYSDLKTAIENADKDGDLNDEN